METQNDPWQSVDGIARRLTMDGLTRIDVPSVQPALAVRWESQNADHRWQFWIRANVHFHDGTPLTAEIVAASLSQSCRIGCPWTAVRAVGPSVVFTSDLPQPDLPAQLARAEFLISHPDAQNAPDGTGPFRVTGFANGVMTFAASEDCWNGRPFLDAVELKPKRSIRDQWLDLSTGRADLVEVPPEQLRQAQLQHLTVLASAPVDLLALQIIGGTGSPANETLRQAIALAVDRGALYNVIFQKQGEITAGMLPDTLSGYAFLFSPDRSLSRAQELRGGASPAHLTVASENGDAEMQLAVERIALNLSEAGFQVRIASPDGDPADIVLRRVHLQLNGPRAALDEMVMSFGQNVTVTGTSSSALYRAERDFLSTYTVVPLLWLSRAYAVSERVRDLRLTVDGMPLVAGISLEDTK
jgi:peptide/nickel transport system substrate-binding protein